MTNGNDCVAIRFNSLMLMQSWFQRYKKYDEDVQKSDKIKNVKERKEALEKAYREFDWWMDIYPVTDPYPPACRSPEGARRDHGSDWTQPQEFRFITV